MCARPGCSNDAVVPSAFRIAVPLSCKPLDFIRVRCTQTALIGQDGNEQMTIGAMLRLVMVRTQSQLGIECAEYRFNFSQCNTCLPHRPGIPVQDILAQKAHAGIGRNGTIDRFEPLGGVRYPDAGLIVTHRTSLRIDIPFADYPRECGETCVTDDDTQILWGLSPRVRGNRFFRPAQVLDVGSIPTSAGKPHRCCHYQAA